MPSSKEALDKAFKQMARGSQADAGTVTAVAEALWSLFNGLGDPKDAKELGHRLQHHLRDLLQAAGWLYPCCMPGSLLPPDAQYEARAAWQRCALLCCQVFKQSVKDKARFQLLVKPSSRPQIPGVYQVVKLYSRLCGSQQPLDID
jgi:hypothetical protein